MISRDCAEPDGNTGLTQCGFKYAGDCGEFAQQHACKSFDEDGTFYRKCHDDLAFENGKKHKHKGLDHDHHAYKQVITVYVLGE